MIEVLQNWDEVEAATQVLNKQGLPTHITIQKNWDQFLLYQLLQGHPLQTRLLDLGCGDCCTLDFLAALGFTNLHGIDLQIKPSAPGLPYSLYEGDLTQTPFPDGAFDVAVSVSVIEHGVELTAFFQEARRLLQPGGLLFVTTDYWESPIPVEAAIRPFGLTWKIFARSDVESMTAIATRHGFGLKQCRPIPTCADKPVSWYDKHYTFIALVFEKQGYSRVQTNTPEWE